MGRSTSGIRTHIYNAYTTDAVELNLQEWGGVNFSDVSQYFIYSLASDMRLKTFPAISSILTGTDKRISVRNNLLYDGELLEQVSKSTAGSISPMNQKFESNFIFSGDTLILGSQTSSIVISGSSAQNIATIKYNTNASRVIPKSLTITTTNPNVVFITGGNLRLPPTVSTMPLYTQSAYFISFDMIGSTIKGTIQAQGLDNPNVYGDQYYKNNQVLDNNKQIKWLDNTSVERRMLDVDAGNNFNINRNSGGLPLQFFGGNYYFFDAAQATVPFSVSSNGNVGINKITGAYKLDIDANTGASGNPIRAQGLLAGARTDSIVTEVNGVFKRLSVDEALGTNFTTTYNTAIAAGAEATISVTITSLTTATGLVGLSWSGTKQTGLVIMPVELTAGVAIIHVLNTTGGSLTPNLTFNLKALRL